MPKHSIPAGAEWTIHRSRHLFYVAEALCCGAQAYVVVTERDIETVASLILGIATVFNLIVLICSVIYGERTVRAMAERLGLLRNAKLACDHVEELFAMTDMLQAAENHEDASAVLMTSAMRLMPEYGGALYVFNNSQDRLDLAQCWNPVPGFAAPPSLAPSSCWALKRGKPHINDPRTHTLVCAHATGDAATVEVPMTARGQVYGLLVLAVGHGDESGDQGSPVDLSDMIRLARALADSMSLALSNITLQDKLRTLSLRDPLTGLYNRRYMEDALDRYIDLAARSGASTAVIMIDLDDFKRLNDQHGHAKGDAVLRDVAAQLVGGLRPADVVARYGGEELLVILPGCTLADAADKAEALRARVCALSEVHGSAISASFGVSAVPECAFGAAEVIQKADAALYVAKLAGKNCVRTGPPRDERTEVSTPRLVKL